MSTVLVTGASGYIAKHIVRELLEHGHTVRASVRSDKRRAEIEALFPGAGIEFVKLDLTSDDGWADALKGSDMLMHTASPFPGTQPKDREELVRPAVDGTLRALSAARDAGTERVILTSSVAAMYKDPALSPTDPIDESNWTDPDSPKASPYDASKTLAERAAWDFVKANPQMKLTVVNPTAVLGPAMDMNYGTSLEYAERFMAGKDPVIPNVTFGIVDVRDVAKIHVAAMGREASIGERYAMSAGSMSMPEMAEALAREFPDHKITTRRAPDWLIRVMARFVPMLKMVADSLGRTNEVDGSKATRDFDFTYTTPIDSVLASGHFLADNGK